MRITGITKKKKFIGGEREIFETLQVKTLGNIALFIDYYVSYCYGVFSF